MTKSLPSSPRADAGTDVQPRLGVRALPQEHARSSSPWLPATSIPYLCTRCGYSGTLDQRDEHRKKHR